MGMSIFKTDVVTQKMAPLWVKVSRIIKTIPVTVCGLNLGRGECLDCNFKGDSPTTYTVDKSNTEEVNRNNYRSGVLINFYDFHESLSKKA